MIINIILIFILVDITCFISWIIFVFMKLLYFSSMDLLFKIFTMPLIIFFELFFVTVMFFIIKLEIKEIISAYRRKK